MDRSSTDAGEVLVARYEELRSQVVAGRVRGVRRGLAILLQMGLVTWMDTVSSCPPLVDPVTRPAPASSERRLPDDRCSVLVDLLANLALNRLMEVHA